MAEYYALLSALVSLVGSPLRALSDQLDMPLASALIFGLIGAASPCQLSTNLSALAYIGRDAHRPRVALGVALAYVLGKVLVYTGIGLLVIVLGVELEQRSIPVILVARRALGPLMVLAGLILLGLLRPRLSLGGGLADRLMAAPPGSSPLRAFLLGVAFSFAFCPTLFLLFFGLLVPLALSSIGGVLFPGAFALGTSMPVLVLVALLALGTTSLKSLPRLARQYGRYANWIAGVVFLLAGINDTLIYWLL